MPVIGTFSAIKDGYATFGLGLTMGVFGLWAEILSGPSADNHVVLHPTEPHQGRVDGCSARNPGKHLVMPHLWNFPPSR